MSSRTARVTVDPCYNGSNVIGHVGGGRYQHSLSSQPERTHPVKSILASKLLTDMLDLLGLKISQKH